MIDLKHCSDPELISKVAEGDQHAFSFLYDRYVSLVSRRALFILKSELLAEEVLQDVMVKLWENAGSLNEGSELAAYLTTLTKNRSYEILRRKVTEARINAELGLDWREEHNETEESVLLSETRRLLAEGVSKLPGQQQLVYRLCKEEGLKYEEAAAQLNISIETVRSHMKAALRFLRGYLAANTDVAALAVILKIFFK